MIPWQKIELAVFGVIGVTFLILGFTLIQTGMLEPRADFIISGYFVFFFGLIIIVGIIGYLREKYKVEAEEPCDLP